ncbi:MAG TPA: 4-hydroxy-3-methylbut-2-en-1-yl diphosphate synthase [Elusimicrobia bacterium]|nr:4-hydroxy-3-methylbut-2-en-1-yl diphosphate synthase [Elusimicrobiota bacterium]HBT61135.1 4-hydroxy-3-methylbut-2-en-1-yl diphosphate synthase [Elusimicrobiota bacterium]
MPPEPPPYCADLFSYRRRRTRVVMVGRVGLGGENPLRLQSMTTTDTLDVEASVAQALRLAEAGCELVRLTAPTLEAARSLEAVKAGLLRRGADVPLVADIHFSPEAALAAADFVEKIRINPGNFADSKTFARREDSEADYARALDRVRERLAPLVEKLRRLKRSLRIGVNHGSLSDRIMSRYGDTALGMVESALEFARLCEELGYRELVFSMKASNVKVMIAAYRLLAARMAESGMDYPFHLGVTEAGEGEDGRIKSAIGIGSLLEDGIGDTLRVSLTEEPEREIPVCRALARGFQGRPGEKSRPEFAGRRHCPDSYAYTRRPSRRVMAGSLALGDGEPVRVAGIDGAGAEGGPEMVIRRVRDAAASAEEGASLLSWLDWRGEDEKAFLQAAKDRGLSLLVEAETAAEALRRGLLAREIGIAAVLGLRGCVAAALLREYRLLAASADDFPLHLRAPRAADEQGQVLDSAVLLGSLLCDGVGDSVEIDAGSGPLREARLAYDILQGAGVRLSKTEFISCPGCGRTLFDLQAAAERVKRELGHLKGVKIAVMGCVVNGPGEMADADFGYVGGAAGMINLYVGRQCVQKGVPAAQAVQALKDLIRARGRWVDKK